MTRAPSPILLLCSAWMAALALAALFGPALVAQDMAQQDLLYRLKPPVWAGGRWQNPLGTDNLGRDVLARLLFGMRISLVIATLGTLIGAAVGIVLGLLAAHFRGWVDETVMTLVDFQAAVPFIILAIAVLAFLGNSFWFFILLLGLDGWERYARLARGLALQARGMGYVAAARLAGIAPARIYMRQITPNIVGALVVQATLNFPQVILLESTLSFLGLGVQPPLTSLGLMLGQGRNFLVNAWWISVFAGVVIFLTTLSMSILGDRLRDWLDPSTPRRFGV